MSDLGARQQEQQQQIEGLLGMPTVRSAIGFSILGLLAALILAPALNNGSKSLAEFDDDVPPEQFDRTITGSIDSTDRPPVYRPSTGTVRYTIRRSVWQSNPNEPCYIYENGALEGGC